MSIKIQKRGGVVHNAHRDGYGDLVSNCGSGERYAMGSLRQMNKWIELPESTETTCKKCQKQADEAERLGVHLTVAKNENGSSRVVDTRDEIVTEKSHVEALTADKVVPAGMFDPELTYYADGTHVVMRAQGTEQQGIAVGMTTDAGPYQFQAVRFADGTVKNVAPHVLHRDEIAEQAAYIEEGIEIDERAEQADAEAGDLLDAVLGEPTESFVTVTVDRYTEGRASVKMQGHAFGDMTREAYRIGRKWELIDQEHGIVFFTIRAGSLQKAVKAWAKKLNTHAERIDVARSF